MGPAVFAQRVSGSFFDTSGNTPCSLPRCKGHWGPRCGAGIQSCTRWTPWCGWSRLEQDRNRFWFAPRRRCGLRIIWGALGAWPPWVGCCLLQFATESMTGLPATGTASLEPVPGVWSPPESSSHGFSMAGLDDGHLTSTGLPSCNQEAVRPISRAEQGIGSDNVTARFDPGPKSSK